MIMTSLAGHHDETNSPKPKATHQNPLEPTTLFILVTPSRVSAATSLLLLPVYAQAGDVLLKIRGNPQKGRKKTGIFHSGCNF